MLQTIAVKTVSAGVKLFGEAQEPGDHFQRTLERRELRLPPPPAQGLRSKASADENMES